ncbi:AraC family transcriptional regulator [Paenibacillus baekrokdamisoli]|uniref:AraC family transcriptional regulator n=1 Tax=Paenibacillus baekrokdamisoli TaxID=1712516 RepID=A0A3G9J4G3_9BACL|nr:helix-turn-helix domain-containing protein [Paenibacillus baekrokdamisoli]MBB3069968.1 YesN/AraC family two-component response regulator [Paenibacillus baekrokdamisoli]BBH20681.1 AraC family transcriptional regulator [Paenibacillus baekrokdamisoli]
MSQITDVTRIEYICKILFESFQIPVFYMNQHQQIEIEWPSSFIANPLFTETAALLTDITAYADETSLPVIRSTNFLENFLVLRMPRDCSVSGTIIIGPSVYGELSEETKKNLLKDNDVPHKHYEEWKEYYGELPIMNKMRLFHAGMLLHYLVSGEPLEISEVLEHAHALKPKFIPIDNVDMQVSNQRKNTNLHHDHMLEKNIMKHITNGNKKGLLEAHTSFPSDKYGVLSKRSHLRSQKNLAISAITLATRAAIDGGLFWEIAYTLSDFHIQHMEELKEIKQVERAVADALVDFADRVRMNKDQKVSKTVAICQNYIFNHLYEEITLSSLASLAGLNANYLSQLFKKEVGIPISDYIQRERIEEAKKLISLSDTSLSDVCSSLAFNDQSYFTKVFKKFTGVTPKQFRNNKHT